MTEVPVIKDFYKEAKQFLEDLQGVLLYIQEKNGITLTVYDILKKQVEEPENFNIAFDEYKAEHESVLKDFFIEREQRFNTVYKASMLEPLIRLQNESDEQFEKEMKKTDEYFQNLISNLPTKYQELHSFATVHHLKELSVNAADELRYPLMIEPLVGTMSNETINACTFTLENNIPIIIVDEDFLSFVYQFSKIFIQCVPFSENSENVTFDVNKTEIISKIKSDPIILTRFKDLVHSVLDGSPRKSEQYILPMDSRSSLLTHLTLSAELFMMGHELGHIIMQHAKHKIKILRFGNQFAKFHDHPNHKKEFEADIVGMHIAIQAMISMGFGIDFAYIGIEMFFVANDLCLRAKKIKECGHENIESDIGSHPSNKERIKNLRKALKKSTGWKNIQAITFLPDVIDETMKYLWENSKGEFYEIYKYNTSKS